MQNITGENWELKHETSPTTRKSGEPATLHTLTFAHGKHTVSATCYSERDCQAALSRELRLLMAATRQAVAKLEGG